MKIHRFICTPAFGATPAATVSGSTGGLFGQTQGQATSLFSTPASNAFGNKTPGFGGMNFKIIT